MKLVKGSDLVDLFGCMAELKDLSRFMSIRSATQHLLEHNVTDIDSIREVLSGWMTVTEPQDSDAVSKEGCMTPEPTIRDKSSCSSCDDLRAEVATLRSDIDELESDFASYQEHHAATERSLKAAEASRDEALRQVEMKDGVIQRLGRELAARAPQDQP